MGFPFDFLLPMMIANIMSNLHINDCSLLLLYLIHLGSARSIVSFHRRLNNVIQSILHISTLYTMILLIFRYFLTKHVFRWGFDLEIECRKGIFTFGTDCI